MAKLFAVMAVFLFGACSDSRHNYEFEAHQGIVLLMAVRQSGVPTVDQVTSMAEAAGKSRWNFCAKLPGSGQHDCISGFPVYSPAYPSGASCFSALHGINAMLKRETTADQAKVCTYPTRP